MVLHPDGRVEGTPQEIADYKRAKECGNCPALPAPQPLPPNGTQPWPFVPTTWPQFPATSDSGCAACDPARGGSGVCGCVRLNSLPRFTCCN